MISVTDLAGREASPTVPTVQRLFEQAVQYAQTDDERALVDLGFRTAFGLHPDYWHEYEVRLVPVSTPARETT